MYHTLFDDALKRYNDKQTRADRRIGNYYEKIRNSKQEKPFHEIILQIGDMVTMSSESENGLLAQRILDEYYQGFQERNPHLKVFSAHLHMDEATPHLHIDFVPFTTGSKRGLDTRVSLKQALANQGFKGGTRGDTEWNQWVSSEKEVLAVVMERHGVEWERKGTHKKHLSVLDFKKQEREKELTELEKKLFDRKDEFEGYADRVKSYDSGEKYLQKIDETIVNEPEYQLPDPPTMMSAKSYKAKFVDPLIKKLKSLITTIVARYLEILDDRRRTLAQYNSLYRDNEILRYENNQLTAENIELKKQNRQYSLLRKVFGEKGLADLIQKAEEMKQAKLREKRKKYER